MDIFSNTNLLDGVGAPVMLFSTTLPDIVSLAETAWDTIPWEDRGAPRRECFFSETSNPYTYGAGAGRRTYWPKTAPDWLGALTRAAEELCMARF